MILLFKPWLIIPFRFQAGTGSLSFVADADNNRTGSFSMDVLTEGFRTRGMNISISGASIRIGYIDTGSFIPTENNVGGGSISLTATDGNIEVGYLYSGNQPIAIQGNVTLLTPNIPWTPWPAGTPPINLWTKNAPITVTGLVDGNQPLTLDSGTGDITITGAIGSVTPIGDLTVNSTGITTFGGPISAPGRNISISGASITTGDLNASGGSITLTATNGSIQAHRIDTTGLLGNSITLTATNGSIIANYIFGVATFFGTSITLTTTNGSIIANYIDASGANAGGSITLTATNGSIEVDNLYTYVLHPGDSVGGDGGAVTLNSTADIIIGDIWAYSADKPGNGGDIWLSTTSGRIQTGNLDARANPFFFFSENGEVAGDGGESP